MLPPECALPAPKPCPQCGQPMPASTPAADPPAPALVQKTNIAGEPPPSGWRDRPPLT